MIFNEIEKQQKPRKSRKIIGKQTQKQAKTEQKSCCFVLTLQAQ